MIIIVQSQLLSTSLVTEPHLVFRRSWVRFPIWSNKYLILVFTASPTSAQHLGVRSKKYDWLGIRVMRPTRGAACLNCRLLTNKSIKINIQLAILFQIVQERHRHLVQKKHVLVMSWLNYCSLGVKLTPLRLLMSTDS